MMTYTVEQLVAVGGREWQRGGMHRVYFNDDVLADLVPQMVERDGDTLWIGTHRVSRSIQRELDTLGTRHGGKVWYDVAAGEWHTADVRSTIAERLIPLVDQLVAAGPAAPADTGADTETEAEAKVADEAETVVVSDARTATGYGITADQVRTNRRPGRCRRCGQLVAAGEGRLYYIDPDEAYEDAGWVVEHIGACPAPSEAALYM